MGSKKYWRSNLSDIDEIISKIERGRVIKTIKSAGNRDIYLVRYGNKNNIKRTANLSSACGCHNLMCYADKTAKDYVPTLMLVGATHGAEFEGTVAILNLINILETGKDFGGNEFPEINKMSEKVNFLLIPCLNPDGRARVPYDSVSGITFDKFRYYAQGTWKDGSLCGWPDCKKIHPILEAAGHLGAYFNDDGINIMHDDFFSPMAAETKFVLDIADEYVPDLTVLLHGGTNSPNMICQPSSVPYCFKDSVHSILVAFAESCRDRGLSEVPVFDVNYKDYYFDQTTAITLKCGEPCFVYESNQGLDAEGLCLTEEEIYETHMALFESCIKYTISSKYKEKAV